MSRDPQGGPSREELEAWAGDVIWMTGGVAGDAPAVTAAMRRVHAAIDFLLSERLLRALDLEEAVRWIESNSVRMHRDEVLGWSAFVHRRDLPFYVEDHDTIIEAVAALRAKLAEKGTT